MNGRTLFQKIKYVAYFLSFIFRFVPNFVMFFIWDFVSIFENKAAVLIRYCIIRSKSRSCGDNIYIGKYVTIKSIEFLSIGDNVSIHNYCYIDASGGIEIHDNVSLAHGSTILSSTHTWDSMEIPIKYNKPKYVKTIINSDVWIGCGVRIMAGIVIGKRVIIGANSICTKSLEDGYIYAGSPARVIKKI